MAPRPIPPIDRLQTDAAEILADQNADSIRERLRAFLFHYDAINYLLRYGTPLWRARKCADSRGYSRIEDVHYPPPSVTPANRCNEPGSPMLYVCFTVFTAFREKGAQAGDFFQLVGYSMQRPVRALLLGEFNNVHKRGQGLLPGDLSQQLNQILNKMSFAAGLSFIFMDAFLSGILADPNGGQRDYLHCRTLSQLLFEKYPSVEAIHYPSVALEASMNLAVKPAVVDEAFRIAGTSVNYIKRRYDYGLYDHAVIRVARPASAVGEIEWQDTV